MKCPVCGADMERGEMQAFRGDLIYWAPHKFFADRLFVNVFRRKTIERGGGMVVRIRNRAIDSPTTGHACKACSVVLIECDKPRLAKED